MKYLKSLVQDNCYFFNFDEVKNVYACGRSVFCWESVPENEFKGTGKNKANNYCSVFLWWFSSDYFDYVFSLVSTNRRLCVEAVLKQSSW